MVVPPDSLEVGCSASRLAASGLINVIGQEQWKEVSEDETVLFTFSSVI